MEMGELSQLIQDVVKKDPAKLPVLARKAGKRCSTLLREADPHDVHAKMGIETLLSVMEASGDVSPLDYMAHQLGCVLVKLSDQEGGEKENEAPQ
jgi:hypothetical protein